MLRVTVSKFCGEGLYSIEKSICWKQSPEVKV